MGYLLLSLSVYLSLVVVVMKTQGTKIYDSGVDDDDVKIILAEHNKVRYQIQRGVFPGLPKGKNIKLLKYDKNLAAEAQRIANTCKFEHVRVHDRRWPEPRGVGQNLYMYSSSSPSRRPDWRRAIENWRSESRQYSYRPCGRSPFTGHFTQVIWAETEFIGCGYTRYQARYGMEKMLLVCNYGPAGNVLGRVPYQTVHGNKCNRRYHGKP